MKLIASTDEYTIYQKRSDRYAVRATDRSWINGDDKVKVLLEHKLIKAPQPKAPEPVEEATEDSAEAQAEEPAAEE